MARLTKGVEEIRNMDKTNITVKEKRELRKTFHCAAEFFPTGSYNTDAVYDHETLKFFQNVWVSFGDRKRGASLRNGSPLVF